MPIHGIFRSSYIKLQLNYFIVKAILKINLQHGDVAKVDCFDVTGGLKMNVFYMK